MLPLLLAAVTAPPPAASEAPADEIVVTAPRAGYRLEGKRLRAAQQAFAADRGRFAPEATLVFEVYPKNGRSLDGLVLTLIRDGETRPVPVDALHRFVLPPLDSADWTLTANRRGGEMALRAWVFSPGAREADRPLGDFRLQCRVSWALQKDRFSFVQRGAFAALGGCGSSRFRVFTSATRPVAAAHIDGVRQALELLPGGAGYHVPLADETLPDTARLRLDYAP